MFFTIAPDQVAAVESRLLRADEVCGQWLVEAHEVVLLEIRILGLTSLRPVFARRVTNNKVQDK